jgi:hypothetical protein
MTKRRADDCSFCEIEWVHVFEQDSDKGAVYLPNDADIPPSRRPREHLLFHADGSAVVRTGGPDDRLAARPAKWSRDDDGDVVVRDRGRARTLRIVEYSPKRLVVRQD